MKIVISLFDKKLTNPALQAKKSHSFSREWLFCKLTAINAAVFNNLKYISL